MKRLFLQITCLAATASLLASCDMFKLDNYDGPNAQVYGKILDAETNEPIQIETYTQSTFDWSTWTNVTTCNSGSLVVIEDVSDRWEGFSEEQDWLVKFNGEYRNDMVFAGKYSVDFQKLPVYSPEGGQVIELKKGSNNFDFKLTPYCRIVDPEFNYDAASETIRATFSVKLTDMTKANNLQQVVLCSNTSNFVGQNFRQNGADTGSTLSNVMVKADGTTDRITLTINAAKGGPNNEEFQYERAHYLRIGALAKDANPYWSVVNTRNIWNFSPVYVMGRDKKISLYDWTTAN